MAKKKYEIEVMEVLSRVIEVFAKSRNDAISKIREKYMNSEIVLDYDDFVDVEFLDINAQSPNDEKDKLVNEIINYLYEDEKKHFEQYITKPDDHIFLTLKKLKILIDGTFASC